MKRPLTQLLRILLLGLLLALIAGCYHYPYVYKPYGHYYIHGTYSRGYYPVYRGYRHGYRRPFRHGYHRYRYGHRRLHRRRYGSYRR